MSNEILIIIAIVAGIAYLLKRGARLKKEGKNRIRPR